MYSCTDYKGDHGLSVSSLPGRIENAIALQRRLD